MSYLTPINFWSNSSGDHYSKEDVVKYTVCTYMCTCTVFRCIRPIIVYLLESSRKVFLVCPMKNVPVLVQKEFNDEYKHKPLPTDGEVSVCMVNIDCHFVVLAKEHMTLHV